MLIPERRRRLLEQVRQDGSASVEQLSAALDVSPSTVRRDLAVLESGGRLSRARGGAYVDEDFRSGPDRPAVPTHAARSEPKQRIARAAVDHVADGMTIMILAGSTTAMMVPHLASRTITVVTNGLDIAKALSGYPRISIVVLGGVLHREQMTLLGPLSEQSMANLHVDAMFAGAYGIDPEVGVTGHKVIQAGFHHSMLRHTDRLIVLADATKYGRLGSTVLAAIDQVDTFVTDADAAEPVVSHLREVGASVTVC